MNIVNASSSVHTSYYAGRPILYLVFHYTAGASSKKGAARSTAKMFANPKNRPASADYIVDDAEIVQYNPDVKNRYCYSVGGDKYWKLYTEEAATHYGKCRNFNSISVEICSNKKDKTDMNNALATDWYFTEAAVNNAVELGRYLMDKYKIPISRVLMHHNVTGKLCPQPWCLNNSRLADWYKFKARLSGKQEKQEVQDLTEKEVKAIIANISNKDAYNLLEKAMAHASTLPEPSWSAREQTWLRAKGKGITDGTAPCRPITRAETAAMILRAIDG